MPVLGRGVSKQLDVEVFFVVKSRGVVVQLSMLKDSTLKTGW